MIGSAILLGIASRVAAWRAYLPFGWKTAGDRAGHGDAILSLIGERVRASPGEALRVDIVWSAGKAGFASSAADLVPEHAAFTDVVGLGRRLSELADSVGFHFVSSAGGLFEGQRHVEATGVPAPLRPYGFAKLEQEERLRGLPPGIAAFIYRPSSVYGYAGPRARKGLVTVLIQNAIRYQTTRISGYADTIRDYVLADDVGAFIADQIIDPRPQASTCILASGKPTSMMELTAIVQDVLRRQLYFQFESQPSNALNISIRPSSLPSGWRATPLALGVHKTAAHILAAYRLPAR